MTEAASLTSIARQIFCRRDFAIGRGPVPDVVVSEVVVWDVVVSEIAVSGNVVAAQAGVAAGGAGGGSRPCSAGSSGVITAQPIQILPPVFEFVPALAGEDVHDGGEKILVHLADALDRIVRRRPVAAGLRRDPADVARRPDELLEGAAAKAGNAVEVDLGEGAVIVGDDRCAGEHRLDLDAAERLEEGRRQ
jgi:hypothetical protein